MLIDGVEVKRGLFVQVELIPNGGVAARVGRLCCRNCILHIFIFEAKDVGQGGAATSGCRGLRCLLCEANDGWGEGGGVGRVDAGGGQVELVGVALVGVLIRGAAHK